MAKADITQTTLTSADLQQMFNKAADLAASRVMNKLKDAGRITYVFSNSFKKTEELLYLYPKLPDDCPEKS